MAVCLPVTHPKIWKDKASTPAQAWQQLSAWQAAPSLRSIGESVAHGVAALLTRDRHFSLFPELVVENPFV